MFKFGFSTDESAEKIIESKKNDDSKQKWKKSEEIFAKNNVVLPEFLEEHCPGLCYLVVEGKFTLRQVSIDIVAEMIRQRKDMNDSVFKADRNYSDLVTAEYEGGLKIWECTYDLLNYIHESKIQFKNKKVLDLGCGAGILGLFAFVDGANVYFQDYNAEVLRYITLPNVLLNKTEKHDEKDCRFYSGDWQSFLDVTADYFSKEEDKFDYIFTSETIYNCDNYTKLISVFKNRLKKKGIIYLAAKTYYFGVGGGTREFELTLESDNCFRYETCWKNVEGLQREILKISFK